MTSTPVSLLLLYVTDDVEEHICPVVIELSNPDSVDDFRTEAVAVSRRFLFCFKL